MKRYATAIESVYNNEAILMYRTNNMEAVESARKSSTKRMHKIKSLSSSKAP